MKNKLTSAGIIGSTLTLVMSLAPISPAAERAALPFAPGSAQAPPNAVEGADSNPVATSVQLSQNTAIVYHPPPGTGAPKRRVWAGARGPGRADLTITVLTPLEIAFTSRAQPTFYWFASRPITEPIEFVIMPEGSDSIHPLVRTRIAGGASAGINPISLEQLGVRLNSGRDYAWSVEVIFNPAQHSKNAVTTGGVRRIAPPPGLEARLRSASLEEQASLYAENGLWYDALDALSRLVAAHPYDQKWHQQRAALLGQGDLGEAAAFDRR